MILQSCNLPAAKPAGEDANAAKKIGLRPKTRGEGRCILRGTTQIAQIASRRFARVNAARTPAFHGSSGVAWTAADPKAFHLLAFSLGNLHWRPGPIIATIAYF